MRPGRRLAALVLAVTVVTACTSTAKRCDGIADRAVTRLGEVLAELDAAIGPSDVGAFFAELGEFTDEARSAGCDFERLNERVREAAASLHATGPDARFLLDQVQVRGLFSESTVLPGAGS